MAILKDGINGIFSGKVGNVVGYQLNGQNVIRSLPRPTQRKPSPLALINQQRMAAVSRFLQPIRETIRFGYNEIAPKGNRIGPFQAAQSHTFKNALDYHQDATPYVNPEKVLVFRGSLLPPVMISAARYDNGIRIEWTPAESGNGPMLIALAYNPDKPLALFTEGIVQVNQHTFDWEIDSKILTGVPDLHVYLGLYNIRTGKLSDSVYAGCI